jgi:hypothetical protein
VASGPVSACCLVAGLAGGVAAGGGDGGGAELFPEPRFPQVAIAGGLTAGRYGENKSPGR